MSDITPVTTNLPATQFANTNFLTKGSGDFLPSIKLIHGISPEASKIKVGNFLLGEYDLGDKFNCAVVGQRAHALYIKDKKKVLESYDTASQDFDRIANYKNKDSKTETLLFGLEFLCYVFSVGKFGTLFCGSSSSREQGGKIQLLTTPIETRKANPQTFPEITWGFPYTRVLTIYSEMRQFGASFRSLVPVPMPCNDDGITNMPSDAQIQEAIFKFTPAIPVAVAPVSGTATESGEEAPFER